MIAYTCTTCTTGCSRQSIPIYYLQTGAEIKLVLAYVQVNSTPSLMTGILFAYLLIYLDLLQV